MIKKIKILLIEENRILREGIFALLKKQPDMRVVAADLIDENILQIIGKLKPNILLIDLGLQSKESLQIVKLVREQFLETRIIVMGLFPLHPAVREFVQAGVSGFLLEDADIARLIKTIRKVNRGLKVLPPLLTGSLFSQIVSNAIKIPNSPAMTKRELEVIDLVAEGFANKEIAQKLELSTYTVKSHVHNILKKLSLSTRAQIAKHIHILESIKSSSESTLTSEE
ncbi:MAG: response regulator transcription factor [Ignavibacteriota bacterium]